jgi:hypothetical protein
MVPGEIHFYQDAGKSDGFRYISLLAIRFLQAV